MVIGGIGYPLATSISSLTNPIVEKTEALRVEVSFTKGSNKK